MFTLTFYRNGLNDKTVVATDLYSVAYAQGMNIVSINPIGSDKPGVDFKICKYEHGDCCAYYREAYVTNEAGKTIDHFVAPNEMPIVCAPLAAV